MSNCTAIMAIIQENRLDTAVKVQDVLTKHGSFIRVRLGLHDAKTGGSGNSGIILLQLCQDDPSFISGMEQELKAIPNVKVKYMILD